MTDNTPEALKKLVQQLSSAVTYTESSNFDTNKKLWDNYAKDWSPDADFVQKMVKNLPDFDENTKKADDYLEHLGEEWSDKSSFQNVLEEFLFPYVNDTMDVAEIGSGGGRVASRTVSKVKKLTCFDISEEMLKKAKQAVLKENRTAEFVLLNQSSLPASYKDHFDFIYSFDVFPHVDLHTIWKYVNSIRDSLKTGGKALIHTANLLAPLGWKRFAQQDKYTVGGFYFMTPDALHMLVQQAGKLNIIKKSETGGDNMYYNRDYMIVVEKIE